MKEIICGYEIEAVLQHRGNSKVLLLQGESRFLVMKTVAVQSKKDKEQLLREIFVLQRLNHPNIIEIKDVYKDPISFTMPYIDGRQLTDVIIIGGISSQSLLRIVEGLLLAVQHVHNKGFLHCDLKPENILIQDDGQPVIVDFGLAQEQRLNRKIATGSRLYMPPEVQDGDGWSKAGEIYSFGLITKELIEASRDPEEHMLLNSIVLKCLETSSSLRPQDCQEILQKLALDPPVLTENLLEKREVGTSRTSILLLVLMILLLIISATLYT